MANPKRPRSPEKRDEAASAAAPAGTPAQSPVDTAVPSRPQDAPASRASVPTVFHVPEILVSELDR